MFPLPRDQLLVWLLRGCALLAGLIVLLICWFLIVESMPALRNVGVVRFWNDSSWHPAESADQGRFNPVPMLAGTLLTTAGAVVLATPLGLGSALFCRFYAPPTLARGYRRLLELLAGWGGRWTRQG